MPDGVRILTVVYVDWVKLEQRVRGRGARPDGGAGPDHAVRGT